MRRSRNDDELFKSTAANDRMRPFWVFFKARHATVADRYSGRICRDVWQGLPKPAYSSGGMQVPFRPTPFPMPQTGTVDPTVGAGYSHAMEAETRRGIVEMFDLFYSIRVDWYK